MGTEQYHYQIENLTQFRARTQGFSKNSLPAEGEFLTSAGLRKKVDDNGKLLPFSGSTTLFLLEPAERDHISSIRNRLYEECGEMFAEPLDTESFHLTLHDLVNGSPDSLSAGEIQKIRPQAERILAEIREREKEPVRMQMTCVFNMVGTSAVIGFEPAGGEECRRLMIMYEELQNAVSLSYPLTPHVTAAYFKPGIYGRHTVERLAETFQKLSKDRFTLNLRMKNLVYREFSDMNHYMI